MKKEDQKLYYCEGYNSGLFQYPVGYL